MARRHSRGILDDMWDLFMIAPWWGCPVTAGIVYLGFAYLLPAILSRHQLYTMFAPTSRMFAPFFAGVVLLVGMGTWIRKLSGGMLLDRQRGSETINSLTWRQFEELLAAGYRRQGYRVEETGGGGPDGGVDLILYGNGETVYVQCKQWRNRKVGVPLLREFHGIIHSKGSTASRGIFITFGEYTQEATRFAQNNSIELLDCGRLLAMIETTRKSSTQSEHQDTEEPSASQSIPESMPTSTPDCPRCRKPMVLRTARRGSNAGSPFWGCADFPKCRGVIGNDRIP